MVLKSGMEKKIKTSRFKITGISYIELLNDRGQDFHEPILFQCSHITAGKVSLSEAFSGPYFSAFELNTEKFTE